MKEICMGVIAFFLSFITYFYGKFDDWMILLLSLIAIDLILGVITGLMGKSPKSDDGKYDYKIFVKNLGYKLIVLLMIPIGVLCDNALETNICRNAVIIFYSGNEFLSIIKNLENLGISIPPIFNKIEKGMEVESNEGTIPDEPNKEPRD